MFDLRRISASRCVICTVLTVLWSLLAVWPAKGENSSPDIHWGALGYPDQEPVLSAGLSLFRFTEFDGEGRRFNAINETIGFNLLTLSWTEHLENRFKGWSPNVTLGIGPTGDQPTRYLQNEFVHDAVFGFPKVPVGNIRQETDFMVKGALTRWFDTASSRRLAFIGAGFASGSIYHEVYGRFGFRRWSPVATLQSSNMLPVNTWTRLLERLRLSGMYRYSGIWSGAAFRNLAKETHVVQGSITYGWLNADYSPIVEVEIGVTLNSGLFEDFKGDSLEERFWTLAIRVHPVTIETWNDQLNRKDFGPTYGLRLMVDLYSFLPESWKWRSAQGR